MSRHVLLVDPNASVAGELGALVARALPGTTVHVAVDAGQAIAKLAALRPELAVINLNLWQTASFDLLSAAQQRRPPVPVIVTAGHPDDDRLLPALRAGAAGFLLRHDTPEAQGGHIRDALCGVLPLSAPLARQLLNHFDWLGVGATVQPAELEVLAWIAHGESPAQVARRLHIAVADIRPIVKRLYAAAGIHATPAAPHADAATSTGPNGRTPYALSS